MLVGFKGRPKEDIHFGAPPDFCTRKNVSIHDLSLVFLSVPHQ